MSEPTQLPPLGLTLGFVLLGAPLALLALRAGARRLPPRPRPLHRWPSGEAALIVLLPFVAAALLGGLVAPREGEPDILLALLASQLTLAVAALAALGLAARRPSGLESLGLGPRPPAGTPGVILRVYLPGALVFFGLAGGWAHLCRAMGWEERQEVLQLILGLERHELAIAALLAVLVGPFVEELLFRGFLQGFMAQVVGERWALPCASAVFARLHGMPGLPALFVLSLFLGWLQLRTRSLWAPYGAHALHNAVSLALALAAAGTAEGTP